MDDFGCSYGPLDVVFPKTVASGESRREEQQGS